MGGGAARHGRGLRVILPPPPPRIAPEGLFMFGLQRLRAGFVRVLRGAGVMPAPDALRSLCTSLLDDVEPARRDALLARLARMRRADDLLDLRSVLFNVVSRQHGESVARARVTEFDAALAALPRRSPGVRQNPWSVTAT